MANALWNTFDFAHRQTSLNANQVDREADGSFDIVVAHHDPGRGQLARCHGHRKGHADAALHLPRRALTRRPERTLAVEPKRLDDPVAGQARACRRISRSIRRRTTASCRWTGSSTELPTARRVTASERRRSIDERHEQALRLVSG